MMLQLQTHGLLGVCLCLLGISGEGHGTFVWATTG